MAGTGPELVRPGGEDGTLSLPTGKPAGVQIEYSAELIDRIRAETVNSFLSIPHGGVEIGGLLLGTRKGPMVYLAAARPIECEHAGGPSFLLSAQDERQLESLLAHSRNDPELEGLEVLGWYVSHTRRPPNLTPGEVELLERFFPEPLQLIGVVRPEATGAAQFRWFVRDDDGSVDPVRASSEFTVQPKVGASSALTEEPGNAVARRVVHQLPPPRPLIVPDPRALVPPPVRRVRVTNLSLAAAALFLVVAAACLFWWFGLWPQAEYAPPLRVVDTGTQLRIGWDPQSPAVRRAKSAALEIKDSAGNPVRLDLSPAMIRGGSVLYNKPSNKVEIVFRLTDDQDKVTTSMVYFIGREQVAAEVKPPVPPVVVDEIPRVEPPRKPDPIPVAPSTGSAERAKGTFRPPVSKSVPASEPALIEPPKITTTQTMPQATTVPPPLASVRPVPTPPPPVVPEAVKPKPQPTSGRLIWTGDLRKNAVLHVSEQGASAGSLNGKLPGQPVKVSARSAELLDGAIAVYTSDPNANTKAEAPGRRNGWNVTMYKFDPKHAHDLAIVEMPSESNHWKLGIKSVNRAVTMIVIDWQAAGNERGNP